MLAPIFRQFARRVAPSRQLRDCGGGGACCPLSVGTLLHAVGLLDRVADCRSTVVAWARQLVVDGAALSTPVNGEPPLPIIDYLAACVASWPSDVRHQLPCTADTWLTCMSRDDFWGDEGFLAVAADCFSVRIILHMLTEPGPPRDPGVISPRAGKTPVAEIEIVLWCQRHFVAMFDVSDAGVARAPPPCSPETNTKPIPSADVFGGGPTFPYAITPAGLSSQWRSFPDRADHVTLFYSETGPVAPQFSNFYSHETPWSFSIPNWCNADTVQQKGIPVTFPVSFAETAIMACKAALMGDLDNLIEIMQADAPASAKEIGRRIRPFDEALWHSAVCSVAVAVVQAKVQADSATRNALKATGTSLIAEAAPHDLIWGIGWRANAEQALYPAQWRGSNVLGWALMTVRDTVLMPPPPPPPKPLDPAGVIHVYHDDAYARAAARATYPPSAAITFAQLESRQSVSGGTSPEPVHSGRPMELDGPIDAPTETVSPAEANPTVRPIPPSAPFVYPLRDVSELLRLLASENAPTVLVGMEFTGTVRDAFAAQQIVAISVDFRECDAGGMHFCGDVRDVVHLTTWDAIYFFPPCYQHLRADVECLPLKICDGRAFWGCAMVLWCLCCPHSAMVVVEQPDTIVYDGLLIPQVTFYQFRTPQLGDARVDKFMRIAARGCSLMLPSVASPPPWGQARLGEQSYASADERDRARSSWRVFPHTAAICAAPAPVPHPPMLRYADVIDQFARLWASRGHPVPADYANPDARPTLPSEREYCFVRGAGDGRTLPATADFSGIFGGEAPPPNEWGEWDDDAYDTCDSQSVSSGEAGEEHVRMETEEESLQMETDEEVRADPCILPDSQVPIIDVRATANNLALLVLVCVTTTPLVYAHLNGFSVIGAALPPQSRANNMFWAQSVMSLVGCALTYAFMVGRYLSGTQLFTAPIAAPMDSQVVVYTATERRRQLAAGGTWAWCTLRALQGTPVLDAATRAVISASGFSGPTAQLSSAIEPAPGVASHFLFGARPPAEVLQRPVLSAAHAMGQQALAVAVRAEQDLVKALGASLDPSLLGWAERIAPLAGDVVPASLLASLPDFADASLDNVALTRVHEPISTSWMPLPPPQKAPGPGAPACPRSVSDLLLESAVARTYEWLDHQLADLLFIQEQLEKGVNAAAIDRSLRPRPIAIGQDEVKEWARGIVWDCRKRVTSCCVPLDFHGPFETNLNRPALGRLLHAYPDQTLVANLLEGVRLDADVELQTVLVPHLISLPNGFASVEKELRRLHQEGWYSFFADIPFWPLYANGQGATPRKLEDRWRRTTEGGGPRRPTFDNSGLRALSINEASHLHHVPQHFLLDQRPEMRAWLAARGLPRESWQGTRFTPTGAPQEHGWGQWAEDTTYKLRGWQPHSKWPLEEKPALAYLMRDIAVLKRAAERLGEAIYVFGDDVKDYFNQLAMATSELHKLNIVFLAKEGELSTEEMASSSAPAHAGGRLLFVSEERLGFGTHGASNIAQRFSNAILDLYRDRMDEADAIAHQHDTSSELRRYLTERQVVQQATEQPCHYTQRFQDASATEARTGVRVCPQQRLYSAYMFTDDAIFLVVGRDRALRALRTWRETTEELGLLMAIPEKRSLGTWTVWLGVVISVSLGIVVIPRDKLVRAILAIEKLLDEGLPFREYRSLCGLLEHMRSVNMRGRNVMHGLYAPHGPLGASRFGPSGLVTCSLLMRKQMHRWLELIGSSCGAAVTVVLKRSEVEPRPSLFFDIYSDACLEPADNQAGIAGYFHGAYWVYLPDISEASLLTIGALELLGVAFNIICFAEKLRSVISMNNNLRVVLRTDALTSALTLPAETQDSPVFVAIYQWLREHPAFGQLAPHLIVAHTYGEANPYADKLSRSQMKPFARLCAQVGVRPYEIDLPESTREGIEVGLAAARSRLDAQA